MELSDARDAPEELRARRLVLVDEAGRVRATLGPAADGSTALRLLDADERTRAELAIDANDGTMLTLRDGAGEFRCSLVVGPEGETRLHLHGAPAVSLHDEEGQPRAVLALDEHTGMANLSYADAEGKSCLLAAEDPGGGRLHLFQRDGQGRRIPACDPGDPDAAGGPLVSGHEEHPVPTAVPARAGKARRFSVAVVTFVAAFAGALGGRLAPLHPGAPVAVPPAPWRNHARAPQRPVRRHPSSLDDRSERREHHRARRAHRHRRRAALEGPRLVDRARRPAARSAERQRVAR
jgi:hypothetical protein